MQAVESGMVFGEAMGVRNAARQRNGEMVYAQRETVAEDVKHQEERRGMEGWLKWM
jgi:hypothetical protein